MTVESGKATEKPSKRFPSAAFIILLLLAAGGTGLWYLERQSRNLTPQKPVLTAEAKAYVRNLKLSDVGMTATDTYLRQTLVEIVGKVGNGGTRRLGSVDINCVFYDPYGQVVLREQVSIVRRRAGGLGPGATKDFRLAFDNIPESWNQMMPQLVIAQIVFD